jgi:hypothetical protein
MRSMKKTFFHVLFECNKYNKYRTELIFCLPQPENRDFLPNLVKYVTVSDLRKLEDYLAKVIVIRDSYSHS